MHSKIMGETVETTQEVIGQPVTHHYNNIGQGLGDFKNNGPEQHHAKLIKYNMDILAEAADSHFDVMSGINDIIRPVGTPGSNYTFMKVLATRFGNIDHTGADPAEARFRLEQLVLAPLTTKVKRLKDRLDKLDFRTDGLTFYNQYRLPKLEEIDWNIKNLNRFITWSQSAKAAREDKEITAHLGVLKHNLEVSNNLGLNYRMVGRNIILGPDVVAAERGRLYTLMVKFNRTGMTTGEAVFMNRKFGEWDIEDNHNIMADRLAEDSTEQASAFDFDYLQGDVKRDVKFGRSETTHKSDTSSDGGSSEGGSTKSEGDNPKVFVANKGNQSPSVSEDGHGSPYGSGTSTPSSSGSPRLYRITKSEKTHPKGPHTKKGGNHQGHGQAAADLIEPKPKPEPKPEPMSKPEPATPESYGGIKENATGTGDSAFNPPEPAKRTEGIPIGAALGAPIEESFVEMEINSASLSKELGSDKEPASDDIQDPDGNLDIDMISSKAQVDDNIITAASDGTENLNHIQKQSLIPHFHGEARPHVEDRIKGEAVTTNLAKASKKNRGQRLNKKNKKTSTPINPTKSDDNEKGLFGTASSDGSELEYKYDTDGSILDGVECIPQVIQKKSMLEDVDTQAESKDESLDEEITQKGDRETE